MSVSAEYINYESTGFFNRIVNDYINGVAALQPFYKYPVSIEGIKAAIEERKKYPTNKKLLVDVLIEQYKNISLTEKQKANLQQLNNSNTFTITTAHQPNIFTGPLYFIYKIVHAIKLADQLQKELPENSFIPVYYIGSEDADLQELGHVYINDEKHEWKTEQAGAVGRMKVDKNLLQLIKKIEEEIAVQPFGTEIINLIKTCYIENTTIEQATFKLVNHLFGEYGLIVLLPDNSSLKKSFIPVIKKELTEQFSHKIVQQTAASFPAEYKVQAGGREINMFYLKDNSRERIEFADGEWKIVNTNLLFSKTEILEELNNYPERFSPNVILRPIFQEMILPNVAFIGGGSEIAYWLELKKNFETISVPYPVMVVRNSFLIVEKRFSFLVSRMGFTCLDLFKSEMELVNELVKRETNLQLNLSEEKKLVADFYEQLKNKSTAIDSTLLQHVEALKIQALKKIDILEKKMLRKEKKKYETQQQQIHKIKDKLFPHNSLQERIENFMPLYAKWGNDFIKIIYESSRGLDQQFTILQE